MGEGAVIKLKRRICAEFSHHRPLPTHPEKSGLCDTYKTFLEVVNRQVWYFTCLGVLLSSEKKAIFFS